jgi:hypothetical protein
MKNKISKFIFELLCGYCILYSIIGVSMSIPDGQIYSFIFFLTSILVYVNLLINSSKNNQI